MSQVHVRLLQTIRQKVRDSRRVATCLEFGPRFLHSTGQAHKGGPNTRMFLQITCDDAVDLPVPGRKYTFGVVKAAQARRDFEVLVERGRRALRAHLGADVAAGLGTLQAALLAHWVVTAQPSDPRGSMDRRQASPRRSSSTRVAKSHVVEPHVIPVSEGRGR